MRLVHVVPTYFPAVRYGGPIWSVHSLCKALVRRGHDVHVLTTTVDGPNNLDVPVGVPVDRDGVLVCYFPASFPRRLYRSPQMGRQFKDVLVGADFLHLHSIFLWPTSAAARVANQLNVPWCVAPRGALVPELIRRRSYFAKRLWIDLVERKTIQQAAFLHATSALERTEAERVGLSLPPVRIVPNGVDVPSLEGRERVENKSLRAAQPLLLFLGRVSWKKGLDRLILAMASMHTAHLVIAGNDDENLTPRLKTLAAECGVSSRVDFIGPVSGEKKTALLRDASLLVLPSYSENFGNVLLESLAVGRPVAVTPEVGLAPVIVKSGAGVILPADPEGIASSLMAVMNDSNLLDKMGKRGRLLVERNYTWDSIGAQMEAAYEEAIMLR